MSGRGVLHAIDDEGLATLGEAGSDADVTAFVDGLEAAWAPGTTCELDTAWEAIHRLLTDGRLEYGAQHRPLGLAILGGHRLHDGDERIVTVKAPDEVLAIDIALRPWGRARVREAYFKLPRHDYGDLDEDDFEYVWSYFEPMCAFFHDAAAAERGVVFSVEP